VLISARALTSAISSPIRMVRGRSHGRRLWVQAGRAHIEARGVHRADSEPLIAALEGALRAVEGVHWAEVNPVLARIVVVFDADHKPRADVLRRLTRHFADPNVGAVQGRCIVRNSNETRLARSIAVDYYCGYLVNEYGRQSLFELPAYGGSNCAVRASWVRAFGGWNEHTVTEDTDLTLRLIMVGRYVRFDVTAIDTEESVPTFRRFWRQRYRWARGHQQAWREYRRSIWETPSLDLARRVESTMFLLVYHVPVFCMLGLVLVALRAGGVLSWGNGIDLTPVAVLLFLGPLLELASGLLVSRAPRQAAAGILLFLPAFVIFTVVCTKSWLDGILGRPYTWVKTPRTGQGQASTIGVAA